MLNYMGLLSIRLARPRDTVFAAIGERRYHNHVQIERVCGTRCIRPPDVFAVQLSAVAGEPHDGDV